MEIGTAALRGVAGPLFIGHGTQKLFGWFGGHGLEGTSGFFEAIGLRPGRRHAVVAGVAETLGGTLLALGALTPLATSLITGSMATAIRKVHGPKGPWITEQGWEYNAFIIASLLMLTEHGPGTPSIDQRLFPNLKGTGWALLAVGSGIAGSVLIDMLAEPAPQEAPQAASAGDPASTTPDDARFTREEAPAS